VILTWEFLDFQKITVLKFTDHLSGNFSSSSHFYSVYKLNYDLKISFASALHNQSALD